MAINFFFIAHLRSHQIQDLIYAGKSTKRGFSKKAIARIEKLFMFLVPTNLLNTWNHKLERASFLLSKNLYRQCVLSMVN